MLDIFLSYLPAGVCLFWIATVSVMASRTNAYRETILFLSISFFYLILDKSCPLHGMYTPHPVRYVFLQLFAPSVVPAAVMALYRFRTGKRIPAQFNLWTIAPSALFVAASLLTSIAGDGVVQAYLEDVAAKGLWKSIPFRETLMYRYHIITGIGTQSILFLEWLAMGIYLIVLIARGHCSPVHVFRMFKGGRITVMELQIWNMAVILILVFLRSIVAVFNIHLTLFTSLTVDALLSLFFFSFGYVSMFSSKSTVTGKDFVHVFRFNYDIVNKDAEQESMIGNMLDELDEETLRRIRDRIGKDLNIGETKSVSGPVAPSLATRIFTAASGSWDEDSLTARFEQLVMGGKLFLRPSLTLVDVAERLHTNKTYVSKMVNNVYNLAFPDLINTLRIDYAEQFIITHRNARQQEIAEACGFQSASSFNNTFKKITGVTPKIWLATYDRENSQ